MNVTDHESQNFTKLDEAVSHLPREIRPGRDLWPEIEARIAGDERDAPGALHWWHSPIVAAASLVIAVGALSFALLRPGMVGDTGVTMAEANLNTVPKLDAGFLANREHLANRLEGRLAELSPEMQDLVRQNLASIRGSLNAINMALAEDPENADLQDLLISTYDQELQVMAEITTMPEASVRRIDL